MTRTILIVDDDQKTRNLLKAYLEKHQYEVRGAQDGASFLAEFERHRDYTDSGFAEVVSKLLGCDVSYTEQGMQQDNYASMEL